MVKIADVQAIPLAIPSKSMTPDSPWQGAFSRQVVVRVLTDDGLVGIGEAWAYGGPLAVCDVVEDSLKPLLLGQDPTRIEYLNDLMQRRTLYHARRGIGMFAISGVDIALWDLLGKVRGAPLYELLGGAQEHSLPAYASLLRYSSPDEVAAACDRHLAAGFTRLKLHQTDLESVRAARETAGAEVEIMLDTNCPWSPAEAIAMARALEPYRLFWLEEPVWPPEDYDGLSEVRLRSSAPIACGEAESTAFGFREIIAKRAADVLQPSVTKVGGVSEFRKVGALAAAANLAVAPHSPYRGPGLAATLHLRCALGGSMPVEMIEAELDAPLLRQPLQARDGRLDVPTGPGLGVELNDDAVRDFPFSAHGSASFTSLRMGSTS